MEQEELTALAGEAYVYGFPLVFDLDEVVRFTGVGMGTLAAAPFNAFSHATALAGPADTFVSVNNDTVYSIAQLDLSGGPLILHVPDTSGRYYVLQFVDAWTNNFAYIGHRATGTAAGTFVLAPPGWQGDAPGGATVITCPTAVASIVGRFACDGVDDLPAVAALQEGLRLEALADGSLAGVPQPAEQASEALTFFEKVRVWSAAFPPSPADQALQARFEPLGLLGGQLPTSGEVAAALEAGHAAGREQLEAATKGGGASSGWSLNLHLFDYNDSWFEVGTLDDPNWVIQDRRTALITRAVAARVGLWGNHGYEAAYAQVFTDSDGDPLDGSRSYTVRFDEPPPVDAFWSMTMYDVPDYFLVENPVGRYSIGDRTPGIRYADDGSLTVLLQRDAPDDIANWLPTPDGAFRPMMRLYEPGAAVLDGSYVLPPIVRVG
jgi:hypothetical protein